jgi:tRNA-2-methylthio-N6-dimethylallyladenosine synthase
MKNLFVKTYGCQMNVYDSDKIIELLKPFGFQLSEFPEDADMIIVNTCHIREKAEHKVFSDLGRYRVIQKNRETDGKETLIGVAGCVAQAEGAEIIKQAPYVSFVIGPQAYHELPKMLREIYAKDIKKKFVNTEFPVESKFDYLPLTEESKISAFLSIQEGCDKFCTYCVVPYTRGAEYSRSVSDILKEARHLVEKGAKELTLLGQNVNAYHGKKNGKTSNLANLILELSEIENLQRIRYTTSHPNDMDDDLIAAHADIKKLMPHLHLPFQSGSNKILKSMNRNHTIEDYIEIIDKFKKRCKGIAFSTDIIVGFPGESEDDFKETLKIIDYVQFAQSYSFKFSRRPGTPADVMKNQVNEDIKTYRLHQLQSLLSQHQSSFNKSKENTIQPVLFDKDGRHSGQFIGKSPYMQSVYIDTESCSNFEHLKGKISDVYIQNSSQNSLYGKLLPQI